MTKARVLTVRAGRDDVANLHVAARDDDPVNEQFDQLYEEAKDLNVKGRSRMKKAALREAVNRRSGRKAG